MNTLAKAIEGRAFPDVRESRPDVPPALAALVAEMTLPDPDDRPRSAALVLGRLIPLLGASAGLEQVREEAPAKPPWYRDRGVLFAATAMVLALEALVLAVFRALRGG